MEKMPGRAGVGKGDFCRACVKVATAWEATDISKASDTQLEGLMATSTATGKAGIKNEGKNEEF